MSEELVEKVREAQVRREKTVEKTEQRKAAAPTKSNAGTKKVVEKGWFARGVKLLIAGFRRDDTFVAKTYKNNGFHQLYKIINITSNGEIELIHDRATMEENYG